jgi:flagellar biosynthesis/type III secretory pathway protein FliH
MTIPVDNKRVERIVEDESSRLKGIHEGITEGILEGMKEGTVDGLKKGAKDGLKECLAEGLGNVSPVDIEDVLGGIGEDVVRTTIREGTKNIFQKSAETYIRGICNRVVNEVQKRNTKLTEEQIRYSVDFVIKREQEAAKQVMAKLPGNPFFTEFAAGIQAALEESLKNELKLCEDRLRQKASSSP